MTEYPSPDKVVLGKSIFQYQTVKLENGDFSSLNLMA